MLDLYHIMAVYYLNDIDNSYIFEIVKAYDSIQVKYSTTLNKDAVVGPTGNDNTAYLDYSNNPYYNSATDSTPYEEKDDSTAVFTYGIDITKADKANESTKLKGATFTVVDKKIEGDKASVFIKQVGGKHPKDKEEFLLMKVGGKWKVMAN